MRENLIYGEQINSLCCYGRTEKFLTVVKYLYLSQSTVSSHIQNLEDDLGKKLLLRTTSQLL